MTPTKPSRAMRKRRPNPPGMVEAPDFPALHERARAELHRIAAAFPDSVVSAVLAPDSPAFEVRIDQATWPQWMTKR